MDKLALQARAVVHVGARRAGAEISLTRGATAARVEALRARVAGDNVLWTLAKSRCGRDEREDMLRGVKKKTAPAAKAKRHTTNRFQFIRPSSSGEIESRDQVGRLKYSRANCN